MSLPSADDFCTCGDVAWQHEGGPLKNGSHFAECRRGEARELLDEIERLTAVVERLKEAEALAWERGFKRARAKL